MKLISANVDWMEEWANDPFLRITVDSIPDRNDFRYEKKHRLYFAHLDGYVSFFSGSTTENEGGYGGRSFKLCLTDGEQVTLLGPWSSRAGVMNKHFKPHCVDVTLYESEGQFPDLGLAGAVTLPWAEAAASLCGVQLIPTDEKGDLRYNIVPLKVDETSTLKMIKQWEKYCEHADS